MKILKFPLARIAIWFVLGVLAAFYFEPSPKFSLLFCGSSIIVFGIAYYFSQKDFLQKIYYGISVYLVFFSIGISTQAIHNDQFFENHYSHKIDKDNHYIEVILHEKLRSNASNERYIAKVCSIDTSNAKGKILLSISKDSLKKDLTIGTRLYVYGAILEPRAPSNPNQFNYKKYLASKSIYGQLYTNTSEIKVSQKIDKNIWYYASEFRNNIIRNLKSSGFKNEELNVVIALILGQQQDISPELLKDYQLAGAVHILSVSGLHVGCIMIFIGFLLSGLPKTRWGNFIKIAILLSFLWAFAVIAGFSPSVTRSVVMFSFVAIGKYAYRKTDIFHTLIVSMLLILLFEPSFIFDIGFQLSYCALFFIVWLQPLIASIWEPKFLIMKYFWDILTVSFAAQIGTFPLSTYYFHQFPGLFFITNLLVLPLLGFILVLGVFVLLWASFDRVPKFIIVSLEWSISILNKIINWVASFESFIFQDISFSWQMLLACYLLIIAFVLWFKKPNFQKASFALTSMILLQLAYFGNKYFNQKNEELIVFNTKRSTILAERNGEDVVVFTNSNLSDANLNFIIRPYLVGNFSHIKRTERIKNLLYFNKNKILILDSLGIYPKGIHPDILIMTQSPKINLERILLESKPKMIVADASNYKTDNQRWKATCEKEKIPFHSTVEKGFYSLSK